MAFRGGWLRAGEARSGGEAMDGASASGGSSATSDGGAFDGDVEKALGVAQGAALAAGEVIRGLTQA